MTIIVSTNNSNHNNNNKLFNRHPIYFNRKNSYLRGGLADRSNRTFKVKSPRTVPSFSNTLLSGQISCRALNTMKTKIFF